GLRTELEARVHHPLLAPLVGEQALDHQTGAEAQPADRPTAHPHDGDLSGPVGQDRLERLVALERPDRDPSDHPGELHARARGRLGDPNAARDTLRPRPDLLRVPLLVALRHPTEEPPERIEESHRFAAPSRSSGKPIPRVPRAWSSPP